MKRASGNVVGAACWSAGLTLGAPAPASAAEGDRHRCAVRPHRADPDRRRQPVPGLPRLHRPGEQQGRRRGPQDPGRSRSTTSTRCRTAMESYERHKKEGAVLDRRLRHAADLRPDPEADRGQDPGHLARLRQRRGRRRDPLPVHLPDRRHLLVAGRRRGEVRQEPARRQPQGQEDRVSLLRQSGRAASRSRCSRTWPGRRASSSRRSRCRPRAWRWAPRCSTSPSATGPTS